MKKRIYTVTIMAILATICHFGCTSKPVVGDIIVFGHYEQDYDDTNGKEPIEWRVLDVNAEGQLLVISEKVLESKRYNEKPWGIITWETSTIRSWLNGYPSFYNANKINYESNNFIDAAFTAEEQAKIVASIVPAHENPNTNRRKNPGYATKDKIFLLSVVEAQQYFANDTARLASATRYVVKTPIVDKTCPYVRGTDTVSISDGTNSNDGTCTNVYCFAPWRLRTPGVGSDFATKADFYVNVDSHGVVNTDGFYMDGYVGIRPALWLNY